MIYLRLTPFYFKVVLLNTCAISRILYIRS